MQDALDTLRPLRRVNSLPGSLADPTLLYEAPSSLDDALTAPRQSFSTFDKGMRISPATVNTTDSPSHAVNGTENRSPCAAVNTVDGAAVAGGVAAAEGSMTDEASSASEADVSEAEQTATTTTMTAVATGRKPNQQQQQQPNAKSESVSVAQESEKTTRPVSPAAVHKPEEDQQTQQESETVNEGEPVDAAAEAEVLLPEENEKEKEDGKAPATPPLPALTAAEEYVAYDAAQMKEWLVAHRNCQDHCPAGIARFLRSFPSRRPLTRKVHGSVSSSANGGGGAVPEFGSRLGSVSGHEGGAGGGAAATSGKHALEALGDIWEDRKDMPIAITTSLRRRGLFGGAEKKELHQMVIAVLNKVTTDPAKFREVKNELLRLPIPEASAEQLDDVVGVFFTKAVHEPHFCHSYADLIAALCKVPQGQHISGDKTLSLEFRLRQSLLRRCQKEFVTSLAEDAEADEGASKERRDVMVGNVRFVSELFLRGIVTDNVVTTIFVTCCTGSEFATLTVPPTHTPTEAQVDQMVAAVQATGLRFFVTKRGQRLLPALTETLRYWTQHHPTSRCRFILMKTVETLCGLAQELLESTMTSSTAAAAGSAVGSPRSQVFSPLTPGSEGPGTSHHAFRDGMSMATAESSLRFQSPAALAPVHSLASPTAPAMGTPKSATTVGGKALPVPRSQRIGSTASVSLATLPDVTAGTPTGAARLISNSSNSNANAAASPIAPTPSVLSPPTDGRLVVVAPHDTPSQSQQPQEQGWQPPPPPQQQQQQQQQQTPAPTPASTATPALTAKMAAAMAAGPKQPVRTEAVAKLMLDLGSGAVSAEATVEAMLTHYEQPLQVLAVWLDRCLSVVREEKTRLRTGELFSVLARCSAVERETLRERLFAALQTAVHQKLHEDLKVFRFWAQCVLSDSVRAVLDEELLEDGLEFLYECYPSAVRAYLVDVGAWYTNVLTGSSFLSSDEATGFARYRPLLRLHLVLVNHGLAGGELREAALKLLNFPDVRKGSLEVEAYCLLCARPANFEGLFEKVRLSPRLKGDPTLAAAVLSALLLAELGCPDGRSYLEDALPTLLVAVDGPNRREREVATVVEVQEVICTSGLAPTHSADARVLMKLRNSHVVSDESIDRARHYLHQSILAAAAAQDTEQPPPSEERNGEPQQIEEAPVNGNSHSSVRSSHATLASHRPPQLMSSRTRTDSLRSASDKNSSSDSSRRGGHPGGSRSSNAPTNNSHGGGGGNGGSGSGGGGGGGHDWRSSTGSLRSGPRSPDANQAHGRGSGRQQNTNYRRGGGSGSHGGRGQRQQQQSSSYRSSAVDSATDSPVVSYRVTGYQRPGAAATGPTTRQQKSAKYGYQSSSSYRGGGGGGKHSASAALAAAADSGSNVSGKKK